MPLKNFLLILVVFCFGANTSLAQSLAHERSAFAVIDPVYSSQSYNPPSNIELEGATWIYGAGELESWRLKLLMARKDSAELRVGHPGVYHTPYSSASYRLFLQEPIDLPSIRFRAVGQGRLYLNGILVGEFDDATDPLTISNGDVARVEEVRFELSSATDPPALLIEEQPLSTTGQNWQWKGGNGLWESAFHFPQTASDVPPHLQENPEVHLQPIASEGGLYDFGRELLAFVFIRSQEEPGIFVGESETEARDTENEVREQTLAVMQVGPGLWRSKSALAFQYLYMPDDRAEEVYAEAQFYPTTYRGAFAASDSTLTRI